MRIRLFAFLILALLTGAFSLLSFHTDSIALPTTLYYVDASNGSDVTGSGSQANPWRTITCALAQVSAGDTIIVAPGTYNGDLGETFPINLTPGVSLIGADRDTTVIAGQDSQPTVSIHSSTSDVLSDTLISNLTLQNGNIGLYIYSTDGSYAAPSIENLRVYANNIGIQMMASYNGAVVAPTLTNTEVISNTETGIFMRASGYGNPSRVASIIANSAILENGSHGLHLEASSVSTNGNNASPRILSTRISNNGGDGIYTKGTYQGWVNPVIERNRIINNSGRGLSWQQGVNNGCFSAVLTNTVIAHNQKGGIYLDRRYSGWKAKGGTIRIVNNTLSGNADYGIFWRNDYDQISPMIINSILWNPDADELYATTSAWTTNQVQFSVIEDGDLANEGGNLAIDPLLLDDYHLAPCSLAKNRGTMIDAPLNDIDGEPRPMDGAPDIGADESSALCLVRSNKKVSAAQARIGNVLTYTITLTNVTSITSFNVSLIDTLPTAVSYEPGSLWASRGIPYQAADTITWSNTIAPGEMVTIGFQTRIIRGNITISNSAIVAMGSLGIFRSPRCRTLVEPERNFLPLVAHNYCSGPIRDDFGNSNSGWPIAETTYWSYGYLEGEYRFYAKQGPVVGAVSRGDKVEHFTLEVDARQASITNGSLGLLFGLNDDWSEFYTFEIYPGTQEFVIFRYLSGYWYILDNRQIPLIINPGQNSNHLKLDGSLVNLHVFYINGKVVAAENISTANRRVGLTATADGVGFDARFDNYKLVPQGCPSALMTAEQSVGEIPEDSFETFQPSR